MSNINAQKPTFSQIYNQGDFVDAKDNQGDWRVGYIITKSLTTQFYKVRFDGWNSKYDEYYKFTTQKLKPFRTCVIGYTGQMQNPGLRESWKFSVQNIQQRIKELKAFIDNPLAYSVHQLNQFIRGHNYLYIDFLMTVKYADLTSFNLVVEFFWLNIDFLVKYIDNISKNLNKVVVLQNQFLTIIENRKDPQQMTVQQAYYFSFYEIFDSIYTIFGNIQRLDFFFKSNQEIIRQKFKISPNRDHKRYFRHQGTKHLMNLGGIQLIDLILQHLLAYENYIPFLFLSAFAHFIGGVASLFVSQYKQNLLEKLLKIGEENVLKIKEIQLKQIHRKQVSTFIQALTNFSRGTKYEQTIEEWGTLIELNLSFKMIICPYFQRKLKGVTHINQVCQRHQSFINKNDYLRNWINKHNLFKTLFIDNSNLQIIKKSCELTRFLIIRKMLKPQDIDIIWSSRIGKHETVIKQIFTLISELPYYEKDVDDKVNLFNKISTLPEDQWDEEYIRMIRLFSQYAFGYDTRENMKQTYGFSILYKYTLKSETDFAIGEFVSLLHYFQNSQIFNNFQQSCFQQIQKRSQVKTYIRLLLKLVKEQIETYNKIKIDAPQILVDLLQENANSQDTLLLTNTFQLLESFVRLTTKYIDIQLVMSLWKTFIKTKNKNLLFDWMFNGQENGKAGLEVIFKYKKMEKFLLLNLWTRPQQTKYMDQKQITIMIELFKLVNQSEEKNKKSTTLGIQVQSSDLIGYNILWITLKQILDQKGARKMCDFLASFYNRFDQSLLEDAIKFYSQNIVSGIKQCLLSKNNVYLVRLLNLIKHTFDYDDEIYHLKPTHRHQFTKEYAIIKKDTNEEIVIKFSCTNLFYDFKKAVSSKFNIPLNRFYLLSTKGIKLTREHFSKSMLDPSINGNKFFFVLKQEASIIKTCFNNYLNILFNLLDDAKIQKLVWSIVERLPISQQLKIKMSKAENIFSQLQQIGFYKQLYMLRVMLELSQIWWFKLVKSQKLTDILPYFQKVTFKSQIEEEFVIALTAIVIKMLTMTKHYPDLKFPDRFFTNFVQIFSWLFNIIEKEGTRCIEAEQKIIKNIFQIANILSQSQCVVEELANNPLSQSLFNSVLIKIEHHQIRNRFVQQYKNILKNHDFQTGASNVSLLLGKLFANAINSKDKNNLKEYYNLTSFVLSKCSLATIQRIYRNESKGLVFKLFDLIKKQKSEESPQHANKSLEGYLTLLKHLVKLQDEHTESQILSYLINQCLFSENDPKCKSPNSKKEAFNVLLQLSDNDRNMSALLPFLVDMHKKGHWRSRKFDDWGITLNDKLKSSTGYVGLKNLGCICYMNSFMQQLFMIPYFRYSITNAEDSSGNPLDPQENVLYQLQKMFMNLQYSQKKSYIPKQFCHAFKDYDGNPTNVTEQMDIDQFSNILFDRIENLLKNTQYSTLIKDMYGGIFSNQIVCKGCPHYSESEEPFLSISLTVKNKKNIYQSFESIIKGDTLEGDNAYYCQRCNKKVTAVKRMSLKKLPNHLIITLKRFQFDYEKMIKLKVNDFCEFPQNLNLKQYSQQFLRKQQNSKTVDEQQVLDNDYFTYVLKGFVVHVGHADSGHYYSIIQDRGTGKWFEFNDSVVREFDIQDLAEQAFGGDTGGYDAKQKIKNAYMVIYERQKKITIGNEIPFKRQAIKRKESNENIVREIMVENKEHKLQNILFSKEYTRYIIALLNKSQKLDYFLQKKILKFALIFYLTITIRQKTQGINEFILKRISKNIDKHKDLVEWIVGLFSIEKIYDEFFVNNPYRELRKLLSYWLSTIFSYCSIEVKKDFCNSCINKITSKGENCVQICVILFEILSNERYLLQDIIQNKFLSRLIHNINKQKNVELTLLPQVMKESQIGYQVIIPMSAVEQMRQRKLRSLDNENEYVWALFNLAIRFSVEEHKIELRQLLPQSQFEQLYLQESKLYKIQEQLKNKFAIYEFTKFISYLTKNNQHFLKIILNQIFTGLKDFQSKRYRQFMLLFQQIISVNDQLLPLRLECFNKIIDALKHNQQYSIDSNIIQQWIVILLNRNPILRDYLDKQVQILEYLHFLSTKKVPSDDISRKNKKFNESMINKLHGVVFYCSKKAYTKLSQQIKQIYQMIIDKNWITSNLWPSVPDNYQKKRAIGDKVGYFDTGDSCQYQQSTISGISYGKIELTQSKSKTISVWKDDQKLINEIPPINEYIQSEASSEKLTEELQEDDSNANDI